MRHGESVKSQTERKLIGFVRVSGSVARWRRLAGSWLACDSRNEKGRHAKSYHEADVAVEMMDSYHGANHPTRLTMEKLLSWGNC